MSYLELHAAQQWLHGATKLGLCAAQMPQVADLDARLGEMTGAGLTPVAAPIPQKDFSTLLSQRRFPIATFIRRRQEIDYLEEPDIFHEIFGHAPMLTDEAFCQFLERFGTLALSLPKAPLRQLFRLFWFTVEFGLIREEDALKAFGAGIMSSPTEAKAACNRNALRKPFDLAEVLRTPYRIDIVQPVYFIIDSFEQLVACLDNDILAQITQAKEMGDLPALFDQAA
ncbi:MAG: phenylalanine-4-hydroxylase [Paracoccaceae bacterium]|jgi:phenylalanine-4-hydroxylase